MNLTLKGKIIKIQISTIKNKASLLQVGPLYKNILKIAVPCSLLGYKLRSILRLARKDTKTKRGAGKASPHPTPRHVSWMQERCGRDAAGS